MNTRDYLTRIIQNTSEPKDFNLILSNILNYLWRFTEEEYQHLVGVAPIIDFSSERQICNCCKLFAIIRYIGEHRKLKLNFNDVYFDTRLFLDKPYYGEYSDHKDCVRMLMNSPQSFYDYNVFYYPYSLEIK